MLLANIIIVVMALFFQGKYFPEKSASIVNELDTLALPSEHPESVLAKRAMSVHGLCPTTASEAKPWAALGSDSSDVDHAPAGIASICP